MEQKQAVMFASLNPGDTIAAVAPASHFDRRSFKAGTVCLTTMGFRVLTPAGLFAKDGFLAGSDTHRAALLNSLVRDDNVMGLAAARGGYGSHRILELIDYRAWAETRKPLIGFSDITTILWALWLRAGLVSIHGPTLTTLANESPQEQQSLARLLGGDPGLSIRAEAGRCSRPGKVCAPVVGGNLTSLCHLVGTGFGPRFSGCIVILEDCGEKAYRIDRMVFQMQRAGCFDRVAGIALGRFSGCDDPQAVDRIFMNLAGQFNVPLLAGLPVGHQGPNRPFLHGAYATLDADNRILFYG